LDKSKSSNPKFGVHCAHAQALERQLLVRARKLKLTGKRRSAYVYGTLRKTG